MPLPEEAEAPLHPASTAGCTLTPLGTPQPEPAWAPGRSWEVKMSEALGVRTKRNGAALAEPGTAQPLLAASAAVLGLCPSPGWGQTDTPGSATWIHTSHRQKHGRDRTSLLVLCTGLERKHDLLVLQLQPRASVKPQEHRTAVAFPKRPEVLRPSISHFPISTSSLRLDPAPEMPTGGEAGKLQQDLPCRDGIGSLSSNPELSTSR